MTAGFLLPDSGDCSGGSRPRRRRSDSIRFLIRLVRASDSGLVPAVLGAVGSDSQPTRSGDEDAGYTRVRAAPISFGWKGISTEPDSGSY
ncbi:hypothetical protein OROGR_013564 [Orobanche gracilis]